MTRLVLTLVGNDRAGLVRALSDIVVAHDGNWEESQLADLAGQFAGIVVVSVPPERQADFESALGSLRGLLEITTHPVPADAPPRSAVDAPQQQISIRLLGDDRPGIVREISGALADIGASIARMETRTREAPMAGGLLFEADLHVTLPAASDPSAVRAALEQLAAEILVDLSVDGD